MFFCVRLEAENKTRKMFVNILLKKKKEVLERKSFRNILPDIESILQASTCVATRSDVLRDI